MARSAIVCMVATAGLLAGCGGAETATRGAPGPIATERPAGTIVFASDGNRLTAIDVASGRRTSRRVGSIPACGAQLFVTGGHIVFSGVLKGLTTVFSMPVSLDRRPTRLGTAHMFVPSPTDGRVWLAGTDCDRRAMVGVREVAVDGEVTFESDRRVPGSWVAAATSGGLVFNRGRTLFVWDPGTGRTSRPGLEAAFGSHGNLLAGCAEASDCRDLAIVDTGTARTVVARPSGRHELDMDAEFSPDGSLLATAARAGRRWSVALVDARSGTHTIIPGSRTGSTYPELRWASSSGWLFIRAGSRLKAYRPGAPRAETLPLRPPRSAIAFAAG
jgi:hypothetical protein